MIYRLTPLVFAALLATAGGALAQDALAVLPGQVIGVSGSGDHLSLRLKSADQERVLKIGEAYGDGWTLSALTPAEATLTKGAQTRKVGLGPSGAPATTSAEGAPSRVETVSGLLGTGGGGAAVQDSDAAAERTKTLAAIDQRLADMRAALPPGTSSYALDYVMSEREKVAGSSQ